MKRHTLALCATILTATMVSACGPQATVEPTVEAEPPLPPTPVPSTGVIPATEMAALLSSVEIQAYDPVAWQTNLALVQEPARTVAETPTYAVGDVETFFVADELTWEGFREVEARLDYANEIVAMWVETGLSVDQAALIEAADTFATDIYPTMRDIYGEEWSPGIDNDPRIHILNVAVLTFDAYGRFETTNQYPVAVQRFSNQREMLLMNLEGIEVGSEEYMGTLAHEFEHLIQWSNDSHESTWLDEGLAQLGEGLAGYDSASFDYDFLLQSQTQLNAWSADPADDDRYYGAGYLFSLYLWERLGDDAVRQLARHPLEGLKATNAILAQQGLSVDDVFSDWIVANYLDDPSLEDGRFGYESATLRPICPRQQVIDLPLNEAGTLPQYSARYFEIEGRGDFAVSFQGDTEVGLIPDEAHSGQSFWWSNRADKSNMTLSRAFDLSGVERATLQFWQWADIQAYSDFAYVTISTDGGEHWRFLRGEHTVYNRDHDYGPNYSGVSGESGQPEWILEEVDLTPYVGGEVIVRFEYVTDAWYNGFGWAIDDVSIPEIDYSDDVESGVGGWEASGFVRTSNAVSQNWAVHLIQHGEQTSVQSLAVGPDGSAEVDFTLGTETEKATLVIGAMAPTTKVEASYSLEIGGSGSITAAPAATSNALLQDDFSDVCSGWDVYVADDFATGYVNGRYFVDVREADSYIWANSKRSFGDVIIEVDTVQEAPTSDSSMGVQCRYRDDSNFYAFDVANNGYYVIAALIDGEWRLLRDWTYSEAINRGEGAENHISASCIGDTLSLTINEEVLAEVQDSRFNSGRVGLSGSTFSTGGARVSFDNLVVQGPDYSDMDEVLYADDFNDHSGGWEVFSGTDRAQGYADDGYFIEVTKLDWMGWALAGRTLDDIVVDVDTLLEKSTLNNGWGVLCRYQDESNYYSLIIANGGYYAIKALFNGEWETLQDWAHSDAIGSGEGASNHITASCVGDTLSLMANGVLLAEVQDDRFTSGDVGLSSAVYETTGTRVLFDNLVIREP